MSLTDETKLYYVSPDGQTVYINAKVLGQMQQVGLSKEGKITTVELSDAEWRPLPPIPLDDRNCLAIQNRSGVELALDFVDTRNYADGWIIDHIGEKMYPIKPEILIYARLEAGAGTQNIKVEELA